ncbi:cellulase family glycosylhydrolase [Candidatus Omnitrophota bacterium]
MRKVFIIPLCILLLLIICPACASTDLEYTLDTKGKTIPLPGVYHPNIDLSGRGEIHKENRPRVFSSKESLERWERDIGLQGIFRLQYNLWEVKELIEDTEAQDQLLANYEEMIKKISDAGGIVVLNLFGMPAGLGRIRDKKSPLRHLRTFKEAIKAVIRRLSCEKKFNIWYEVWNAPDLEEFFLGRRKDYLFLYRAVAEAVRELKKEYKVYIPVGGPAVSWWFQNVDGNSILTPGNSLIYDLMKFCNARRLPLDFISWHAYSTDPRAEGEITRYKMTSLALVRRWLTYFKRLKNDTPLIVGEWNYDRQVNSVPERGKDAHIASSYIPARIQRMYQAGVDRQFYYCLEDFQNNEEGINRNVGIFYSANPLAYKGGAKSIYQVFQMLNVLGREMFVDQKPDDEFVGVIATKDDQRYVCMIYNYIDPEIAKNYISRNIALLSGGERKIMLRLIKSGRFDKLLKAELQISSLRLTKRMKVMLKKALALDQRARQLMDSPRTLKIALKNLNGDYLYKRYSMDSSCVKECEFSPVDEKKIQVDGLYQETMVLKPYSVQMLILEEDEKD